jgi:hypothetical protein
LLFKLISSYLNIIFLTITSPFQFLFASLPGRQGIATTWARNMLCHVLAFPAVIAVLYFVAYLLGVNQAGFPVRSALDITGNQAFPLLGNLDIDFLRYLLAYVALIATPAIPEIVCQAVGKIGRAGALIGQEFGTETKGGQQYFNRASQAPGQVGKQITSARETLIGPERLRETKSMGTRLGGSSSILGRGLGKLGF